MLISKMGFSYEIREARIEEWKPAMNMVWKTFLEFEGKDYTREGICNFYEFITDDGLYEAFRRGTYHVWIALDGQCIVGLASLRNQNQLSLLFVDRQYHRKGIGSALIDWVGEYAKQKGNESICLQAAPYAVDFYRKLGFSILGPEQSYGGIRVTVMSKSL